MLGKAGTELVFLRIAFTQSLSASHSRFYPKPRTASVTSDSKVCLSSNASTLIVPYQQLWLTVTSESKLITIEIVLQYAAVNMAAVIYNQYNCVNLLNEKFLFTPVIFLTESA